jgi:hypothetical protein
MASGRTHTAVSTTKPAVLWLSPAHGVIIRAHWWDGNIVTRDYFVAQGEDNAYYWIFQERIGSRDAEKTARWFLHGLFS